jgi:hypothetical protein
MLKFFIVTLLAGSFVQAQTLTPEQYRSSAAAVIYNQNRSADLQTEEGQRLLERVETELRLVYPFALTAAGEKAFLQRPPWVAGDILLGLEGDSVATIEKQLAGRIQLDLTKEKTGVLALDKIAQLYKATSLSKMTGGTYLLKVSTESNPQLVSHHLSRASIPGFRYAEPNYLYGRGNSLTRAEVGGAVLYAFNVGWGDCPAGCINSHRVYFEISRGTVRYVASSGDELPASVTSLFKARP